MATYHATYHKNENAQLNRRISSLGGNGWHWDVDTIIAMIETSGHVFFTQPPSGYGKQIVVRKHAGGDKYLTTSDERFPPASLLSLPVGY